MWSRIANVMPWEAVRMAFGDPPATAAWRHLGAARSGFEVVYFRSLDGGWRIDGCTTAIEDGDTFVVEYAIEVDRRWITRHASVTGRSAAGARSTALETDGRGTWTVDGAPAPELDGCLDVDLEASAFTNALPVHRLALGAGDRADAPAAYVRALGLRVERLEQTYARLPDDGPGQNYAYAAPRFDFECRLDYDETGLVRDYPGIAARVT